MNANEVRHVLHSLATADAAASAIRFFKSGPGQYGEGDQFIGVRVPEIRKLSRRFRELPLDEVETLFSSPIHEERMLALFILVGSFVTGSSQQRKTIYSFYRDNIKYVNNWDLVDSSAPAIVGGYLVDKLRKPLLRMAKSTSLWERRIAIIATQHFIRLNEFDDTLTISQILLKDDQDLIHKAVGWMLREVGGRELGTLESFLDANAALMPRTMLRYAIEHFSKEKRQKYLAKGPSRR
jgi:3-methyladenine DNA glycosylase AlkD